MSKVINSALELIGNTPLLNASRYAKNAGIEGVTLLTKLEYLNPAGSVKDRVALAMIEDAEKKGELKPGAMIIEPTSGNTGIGLAAVAVAKGYRAVLTLPDTMSVERRNLLKAYGAEIVLTEGAKGMKGAIARAEELKEQNPGSVILGQFVNPANPAVHKATTGPEIWEQTEGKVDIFVAGVGTGGTVTGVGEYLKSQNPDVKIVAVEPATSPVLSKGEAGPHKIQGIGAGFVPDTLNTKIYDEVIAIENEDAFTEGRAFAHSEGILVGISSGASLHAAIESYITAAGSEPSLCAIISAPVLLDHSVSCSIAAALKVSAAAIITFLFCALRRPASLPTDVVFPTPLTPISITMDWRFSNSYAFSPRFIFSLILSIRSCLQSAGFLILFSLTLFLRSSRISSVATTPISPIIRVSSSSS